MLVCIVITRIHAQAALLVRITRADGNGNGKHGDVHHDQETELHGWMHIREIERRCARVARRRGLEDRGGDAWADGEDVHRGIVQVEHDDKKYIDEVEGEKDAEENPRGAAREQECVAAAWMLE